MPSQNSGIGSRELLFKVPMISGNDVLKLQRALVKGNYLKDRHADGRFNFPTRKALMALEKARDLIPRGMIPKGEQSAVRYYLKQIIDPSDDKKPVVVAGDTDDRPSEPPSVIPKKWLDNANVKRIIVHWTAGSTHASNLDKSHYHFMVEEDGKLVQGKFRPSANDRPRRGRYAAHTRKCNTGSIGISICGMAGAQESPFRAGRHPFNEVQWDAMARAVAQICHHYGLPVTEKTVLGHGEVQANLGIRQNGKWDPMVLPWDPGMSKRDVGRKLRADVQAAFDGSGDDEFNLMDASVLGTSLTKGAMNYDVKSWLSLPALVDKLKWTILDDEAGDGVALRAGDLDVFVPSFTYQGRETNNRKIYVLAQELAEALDLSIDIEDSGDESTLVLGGKIGGEVTKQDGQSYKTVTVATGDYLTKIAAKHLGDKDRWTEILQLDRTPFDEESARKIAPGQQVLVPVDGTDSTPPDDGGSAVPQGEFAKVAKEISLAVRERVNKDRARKAVPVILAACEAAGVRDRAHIAYMFATAEHETNFGRHMAEIWRNSAAQRRYQGKYGNTNAGDGKLFRGRGYVQLTFKANYRRFGKALDIDLVKEPEKAAEPETAGKILVIGMTKLGYRGSNYVLSRYGFDDEFNFDVARAVVNNDVNLYEQRYGAKRGVAIGAQARKYYELLCRF